MNKTKSPPRARRIPRWLLLAIILGIPTIVTLVGIMTGAHVVEIVIFSMLCLFSVALVFFYALG